MEQNDNGNSVSPEMTVTLPHFNDIRKSTVGETYQYFKKLIEGKTIKNLNECISSSTELPLFDCSLQLMLIDSLQLENEFVRILLSQNESQIKRVLECKCFFQNLSAELCTKEIFPFVSVSVRCKIINRLSKYLQNTEEAEKYFAFIRANYDNARADYILPRCSREFILSYVQKAKPTFDQNTGLRVVQNICKRYPEIGLLILSNIFDTEKENSYGSFKYQNILRYLAGNHPDLMVPFLKKYNSCIPCNTFRTKLTKKLIGKLRKDLFPEFVKHSIFKENVLFSLLCFEEQVKYIYTIVRFSSDNLTPRSWHNSENRITALLKLVPQDKRQEMIESAFKEVYNLSFNEHGKFWSGDVLELLPTEARASYVEKIEKFVDEGLTVFRKNVGYNNFSPDSPEHFLYLYGASFAFERLKKILRKTPASSVRDSILNKLVKSCRINNDLKTLEEVVEYVATRHRNDDSNVIFHFIEVVCGHFSSELNSSIFEKLEDLAYFCSLRGHRHDYVYNILKEMHIYHRLENGLNVDAHLKKLFESLILTYHNAFVQNFDKKHSKFLILALCSEAVSWIRNNPSEKSRDTADSLLRKILCSCNIYNKSKGNRRIFLRDIPGLEEILKEKTKNDFAEVGGEEWPLDVWERYGDGVLNSYYKPACLFYVLKRKPDLIEKYFEVILKILVSDYFRAYDGFLIFFMRTVSFLGKTEKAKEIILNEFKNRESIENRKTALRLYSKMCTIDEFSKVIEDYIPKQEKVEQGSAEGFHEIQILVPALIKNVKPRWKNFPLIFKFFFGDFLKSVLCSLYSCCYNTRCDEVVPFLAKRLEESLPKVSHVKNIIRLILELSDRKQRMEFCSYCWNKHKHYSVRSVVLCYVLNFFLEQRSRESFEVLEKFILDCDETMSHVLPELQKIPDEFLDDYIRTLWRFSEKQTQNFRENFRKNVLQGLTDRNMSALSAEFCESVIKDDLFNPSSGIPIDDFAAAYLAADPETVERRVRVVLDLIKEREPIARSVYKLFNALITKSLTKPSDFADVFTVILENWPEYPPGVLYEERVLFTYHNLHQKVVKRCGDSPAAPVEFGKELKVLYSSVDRLNDLLFIYVECLKSFFLTFRTHNAILALKELVAGSRDRSLAVIAISSMPPEAVVWYNKKGVFIEEDIVNGKKILDEFIGILEGYDDKIVEIYLRWKFEFVKT